MKIVSFRQEDICYMWKDRQIKIDRSDVWGNPAENGKSLLAFCRDFSETEGDETAHVVYLYGQGGVGKSFACGEVAGKLLESPYQELLHVVVVDLQKQKSFEDNLKCLADGIADRLGRKDLFPRFHMAYYSYKMKKGEEVQQEERSTKWEDMHNNSSLSLAADVAGFFTSFGTVSDVIDLANEGYKWFLKMRDSVQYKAVARQIETMEEKELRGQLVRYFAADFRECINTKKDKRKKKKKFAFLLDTVESMRYQTLRDGDGEDYLEWLAGSEGLFRLLPDCFWMLFGREEIPWKNYDREWETTFVSREMERPDEKAIREYLLQQLGQGAPAALRGEGGELYAIADEIIRRTERYSLAIENCVDVYFRIWNKALRTNRVTDPHDADKYRPSLEEIQEMLMDNRGKKIISSRFLMYYTLQEKEVLYTLVCLGTWTDEILENLIWKGAVNNILIYEEMCATSFIYTKGDGCKSIQGLMLDAIMEDCPRRLKKKLFSGILEQLVGREIDAAYWMLFESAIHITRFCPCDGKEWEQLGAQFVRGAKYLLSRAAFYELGGICRELLRMAEDENADGDLYNAVRMGMYFSGIFLKRDMGEELERLREKKCFGGHSLQLWKLMWEMALDAGACAQAYEVAEILAGRFWAEAPDPDYYLILRQKAELMQRMGDRFDSARIEEELDHICKLALELAPDDPRLAEKLNIQLWAEYYYYGRPDLRGEEGSQRIEECVRKYRALCTKEDMKWDVKLCVLEIMQERVKGKFILDVVNESALRGLRILEKIHGTQAAVEQPDAEFLFRSVLGAAGMTGEDRELYRSFFEQYYKKFYIVGNWRVYPILSHCFLLSHLRETDGEETDSEETDGLARVKLSDIVRQGIFYLSNRRGNNMQDQLRILLCYHLINETIDNFWDIQNQKDKDDFYDRQSLKNQKDKDYVRFVVQNTLNNRVLLYFVHKTLEAMCSEQEETENKRIEKERLRVLLRAVFEKGSFRDDCFKTEEKQQLMGVLELCGLEMSRALWKAEYADSTAAEEFRVLDAFCGWQWGLVPQADVRMTAALLYVAWRLQEQPVEECLLERLGTKLQDANGKAHFWMEVLREARSEGGEWERHMEGLLRRAAEGMEKGGQLSPKSRHILAPYNPKLADQPDVCTHAYDGAQDACEGRQYEKAIQDRLAAGDYDTIRRMIDEVLDGMKPGRSDERLAIAYFYIPVAGRKSMDGFMDGIQEMKKLSFLGEYFVLRAYAYLDDRAGFAACYREHRQEIWQKLKDGVSLAWYPENELYHMAEYFFSLNEDELAQDYCRELADLYAASYSMYGYTRGILCQLEWMTKHVSFETVWRRERCIKEIDPSNYEDICRLLEKYLSPEELMDIFITGVWNRDGSNKPFRPRNTELEFFESEYYLWLRESFGEACEDRLRAEFPKLYAVREEYDAHYRESYLWQVNKLANEIKSLADTFVESGITAQTGI